MSTLSIANKLVDFCRQGKNEEARALYADHAVSVEAFAPPQGQQESVGIAAIMAKSDWWYANHVTHSAHVAGPCPHGNRFIIGLQVDVTFKPTDQRMTMEEMGLYTVENGKIVREEFFYSGDA